MGRQFDKQQLNHREIYSDNAEENNNGKEKTKLFRMNAATMCAYFFLLLLSFGLFRNPLIIIFGVAGLAIFTGAYYLSYFNKIKAAVALMYVATILFVIIFIYVFSWKSGVQNLLFVALVLICVTEFVNKQFKIVLSIFICGLRFTLFYMHNHHTSLYELNDKVTFYFEIINILAVFVLLSSCVILYTEHAFAMERKLTNLASEDPLTGLNNRRSILEYIEKIVLVDRNKDKKKLSIAMGDIDFFKHINDRYGHECGDMVLRRLSDQFQKFMTNKGRTGRWGGEEFLLVFENMDGDESFADLTELLDEIRNMDFIYKHEHIHITLTFGLSEYDYDKGVDNVISEADRRLYIGKEAGRNRIIFKEESK